MKKRNRRHCCSEFAGESGTKVISKAKIDEIRIKIILKNQQPGQSTMTAVPGPHHPKSRRCVVADGGTGILDVLAGTAHRVTAGNRSDQSDGREQGKY